MHLLPVMKTPRNPLSTRSALLLAASLALPLFGCQGPAPAAGHGADLALDSGAPAPSFGDSGPAASTDSGAAFTTAPTSGDTGADAGPTEDAAPGDDAAPATSDASPTPSTPDAAPSPSAAVFPSNTCTGSTILRVNAGQSAAQIQTVINGAPSGSTVCFAAGQYALGQGLVPISNVSYQGEGSPGPVLTATNAPDAVFNMQTSTPIVNVTFAGFKFASRAFFVSGGHSLTIDDCLFDGPISGNSNANYIYFNSGPNLTVTRSTFVGSHFDPSINAGGNNAMDACVLGYDGTVDFEHLSFRGCDEDSAHLLAPVGTVAYCESVLDAELNFEVQAGPGPGSAASNDVGLSVHHNHIWYPTFHSTTDENQDLNLFGMSIPAQGSYNGQIYANVLDYADHPSGISGERMGIEIGGTNIQVHDNYLDLPSGISCMVVASGGVESLDNNYCSAGANPWTGEPGDSPGGTVNVGANGPSAQPSFAPLASADDVRNQAGNPLDGHCQATNPSAPQYYVDGAPIPVVCQ